MSEFDSRSRDWDNNPMHWERSEAIAKAFLNMVPVKPGMKAMEYGAGTGILSFLLSDKFSEITLMDSSSQMVEIMRNKIQILGIEHFKPLLLDLEQDGYIDSTFDCILLQMVLHHIGDTDRLINKFFHLLDPGGYLAIADLYPEDGSFHGIGAKVHLGFDPQKLKETLHSVGFNDVRYKTCYEVKKEPGKKFPVFLLVARK